MTEPASVSHTTIAEEALRSALSSGERPKRPDALSASLTFGWRALLGDVARYAMASAIVLALGLVLGFRPEGVVGVLLSVALLVVFAFSVSWNHCAPLPEQGVSGSPQFSSVASTGRPSRWMGSAKLSLRESSARTARIPALRSRGSR
jgi:hypothetical protein